MIIIRFLLLILLGPTIKIIRIRAVVKHCVLVYRVLGYFLTCHTPRPQATPTFFSEEKREGLVSEVTCNTSRTMNVGESGPVVGRRPRSSFYRGDVSAELPLVES